MAVSTPVPDELLHKHIAETRFDAHRELIRALTEALKEEERQRTRDDRYVALAIILLTIAFIVVVWL